MKSSLRSASLYTALFASVLALAACGKDKNPQPASTPASGSTAASAAKTASAPAKTASAKTPAKPAAASTVPAPASTAASKAAATAVAAPALKVASVTVGDSVDDNHQVRRSMDRFPQDERVIYASVDTTGDTTGATLSAKWRYLEGKGQLVSDISQRIATSGPATTTFKLENPDLWPEGKYEVDIALNGTQVASQTFEVKKR